MPTLNDIVDKYKRNMVHYSEGTLKSYIIYVTWFFEFCNKDIESVKSIDIEEWLFHLHERKKPKPSTVSCYKKALRSFFSFCFHSKIIKENPMLNIPCKYEKWSSPNYLEKEEIIMLTEASKDNIRDNAIIDFLYNTGVRVNELTNILIDEVDFKNNQVWIREGKGLRERWVFFTSECGERLKKYLATRQDDCPHLFISQYKKKLLIEVVQFGISSKTMQPKQTLRNPYILTY